MVNDNEQALILASRHIVRGLGCCVRLICHTGKENARSGATDQYAARGGSALPDGARMATVLHSWDPAAAGDKFTPPIGFTPLAAAAHAMVLVRTTLSYVPPDRRPDIWLKRCGWGFEHFIAAPRDPAAEARERADQVGRYLIAQLADGFYHTKTTLDDSGIMPRAKLREALSALIASGRVISAPLPEDLRHGGRKDYLHPVKATPPCSASVPGGVGQKSTPTPPVSETPSTPPPPYKEKVGGGVEAAAFSLSTCHSAGDGRRGSGGVGGVGAVNPPDGQVEGDGPEQIQGGAAEGADPSTCPRCDGKGCDHCGGMGRIVDDEP